MLFLVKKYPLLSKESHTNPNLSATSASLREKMKNFTLTKNIRIHSKPTLHVLHALHGEKTTPTEQLIPH
jgi:hypothetical protein